jgi:hypothetical protein
MKALRLWVGVGLALGLGLLAWACSDPVTVDEPGECDDNSPPAIAGLEVVAERWNDGDDLYKLDAASTDGRIHIYKHQTSNEVDKIILWFRFEDAQCNLDGGQVYFAVDDQKFVPVADIEIPAADACQGISIESLLDEPASPEVQALPTGYGYFIPAANLLATSCGPHRFAIGVTDACGAGSNDTLLSVDVFIEC